MEDENGNIYPMTGVIEGRTYPTGRLVRFGYVNIAADPGEPEKSAENNGAEEQAYLRPGELIRGHEFHYWDSTDSGTDCVAVKPDGEKKMGVYPYERKPVCRISTPVSSVHAGICI